MLCLAEQVRRIQSESRDAEQDARRRGDGEGLAGIEGEEEPESAEAGEEERAGGPAAKLICRLRVFHRDSP